MMAGDDDGDHQNRPVSVGSKQVSSQSTGKQKMWDVGLVLCHERYHTEIKPDRRYGTQIFSRRQRNKEEGKKTVDRQTERQTRLAKA